MSEIGILDVVDISSMEFVTAPDQVAEFMRTWGVRPTAVALPMLTPAGIPFENDFMPARGVHYGGQTDLTYLGGVAYQFAKLGLDIYLTIVPDLSFVRSDALHIVDISGDSSAQACLAKEATRRLLLELAAVAYQKIQEACTEAAKGNGSTSRIAGIAIDIVDLWPMGAKNERIELTCFCQECRQQLAKLSARGTKLVRAFERFPNPWNLLLRDAGDGVSPINDFTYDINPPAMLDISHLKGYDEILKKAGANLSEEAQVLIDYLHTRHRQVIDTIDAVFRGLSHRLPASSWSRVIMAEANTYDWTAGVFLEKLDDKKVCDELWVNPSEFAFNTVKVINRSYMQRRSRYHLDAFFQFLTNCQDEEKRTVTGIARLSDNDLRSILELRRRQAMSGRLASRLDLFCLPPLSDDPTRGRVGFVGPNLSESLSQKLVQNARIVSGRAVKHEGANPLELLKKIFEEPGTIAGIGSNE